MRTDANGTDDTQAIGVDEAEVPYGDRIVERVSAGTAPTLYANNVEFKASLWDFKVDFGIILDASEEKITIQPLATVMMSPQHVKVFAKLLVEHLEKYEKKFGKIPGPDTIDEANE